MLLKTPVIGCCCFTTCCRKVWHAKPPDGAHMIAHHYLTSPPPSSLGVAFVFAAHPSPSHKHTHTHFCTHNRNCCKFPSLPESVPPSKMLTCLCWRETSASKTCQLLHLHPKSSFQAPSLNFNLLQEAAAWGLLCCWFAVDRQQRETEQQAGFLGRGWLLWVRRPSSRPPVNTHNRRRKRSRRKSRGQPWSCSSDARADRHRRRRALQWTRPRGKTKRQRRWSVNSEVKCEMQCWCGFCARGSKKQKSVGFYFPLLEPFSFLMFILLQKEESVCV